jgi:cellulose synthase operon protein C
MRIDGKREHTCSSLGRTFAYLLLLVSFTGGAEAVASDKVRERIKIRKKTKIERPAAFSEESNEELTLERTDVLGQKRRALIEDIKKFIREARSGSPQAAELQLRLGSLYMEDYYANLSKAQLVYEKDEKAFEEKKTKKKPVFDRNEALSSLNKAREIYKTLVKVAPKHERRDEMYYFLAISSMDQGKQKEGMGYLEMLVSSAPRSKYVPDALMQLGDFHFDNNEFKKAETFYDQVLARKAKMLVPYALYKKAWCSYNQHQIDASLKYFKNVIALAQEGNSGAIRLRGETLRDITLPMADKKMVNEAIEYFKSQGAPYYRNGVETLAALYFEQASYPQAITFYEHLLGQNQTDPKNPSYDINVIECLKLSNHEQDALQRLFTRLPLYMKNSTWYELHASTPKVVMEAESGFEELTRKYAFQYHAEGQKTKDASRYEVAKKIYAKYIEFFPATAHTSKVRFYLAEILYKQKQYVPAADQYYAVFEDPKSGNLKNPSIRYALSSLDEQVNADRKKAGMKTLSSKSTAKLEAKEGEELKLIPYSEAEEKFIKIGSVYLKVFPTAKDAPDVLYTRSYLTYLHHDFQRAYKGFWQVIRSYPKHVAAPVSAHLILDILNREKDYGKLIAAAREFLANPNFSSAHFKNDVADILRKAELKRIQLVENEGKFKEAGDQYVEYTKAYGPQDPALFEKALYNASVNYTKAGMLIVAAEVQEQFLRRFPQSNLRKGMLLQVAKTYESLANFEKSGNYFEAFANQYPSDPQSKNALRLAGVYLGGSGHPEKAETIFRTYVQRYPKDSDTVQKDLIELYENQNAVGKLAQLYLQLRAQRGLGYAEYLEYTLKVAELQSQKTNQLPPKLMEEARMIALKYGKQMRSSPQGIEALAKTMFYVVQSREKIFRRISLAGKQSSLEANLQMKLKILKELDTEYARIASMGSAEWGLASIYRAASSYQHMAEAVLAAPVPGELGPEQIEMYRAELQKQMIKPFQEKAKNMGLSCLEKAQEFNVLSTWTSHCYQLVSTAEPERYPPVRTFYLPAMRLAVAAPTKDAQIEVGNLKKYPYPMFSSALFEAKRMPASEMAVDIPDLYNEHNADKTEVLPHALHYHTLTQERASTIKASIEREKPEDLRKGASFAFLNLMRVASPKRASGLILDAIQKDPKNYALHNLLALSHLEAGDFAAARITWLALVAQGIQSAAVWNNLGVLANMEGREDKAIAYFREAAKLPFANDALINLGFTALKYRNGFEAKNYFKKALEDESNDIPAKIGFAVAMLQNRETSKAKDELVDLSENHPKDPYLKLSLGYYLIDVEQEADVAKKIIDKFIDEQNLDGDMDFRQISLEAREAASKSDPGEISTEME